MFKIKYFLFALFLLANVSGYTQYIGTDDEGTTTKKEKTPKTKRVKTPSVRKQNKKAAIAAIRQLKNGGAVLYMIRDQKINAKLLKEKGYGDVVAQREEEAKHRNLFIVRSLAKKFTFCPIYFFYQSDLEKIQKGQFQGSLLDSNLVRQPGLTFNHPYFLILDYGDLYNEPGKIYSDTGKADISGRLPVRENCFVFKNKYLSQLMDPFPEPVRVDYVYKELYYKIRRMNKRLAKFYEKHAS